MSKSANTGGKAPDKKILLVDRHDLMRNAAAEWIRRCEGLEVCGMASGMAQAFRAIEQSQPDLVVSEILQPGNLRFIEKLHQRHPRLPILVFSMHDEAVYGARARAAGASGYLMKSAGGAALIERICVLIREKNPKRLRDIWVSELPKISSTSWGRRL